MPKAGIIAERCEPDALFQENKPSGRERKKNQKERFCRRGQTKIKEPWFFTYKCHGPKPPPLSIKTAVSEVVWNQPSGLHGQAWPRPCKKSAEVGPGPWSRARHISLCALYTKVTRMKPGKGTTLQGFVLGSSRVIKGRGLLKFGF